MSYNALAIQAVYAGEDANRGIQETEAEILKLGTTTTATARTMQSAVGQWAQSMTQSRVGQILEAQRSAQAKVADVTEQTAKAATLGGEKLARYATVIGLTTGQFQRLGIQGDLLARVFAVGGDLAMGLTGPWGMALIGAGALATAIGALVNRQRELKKATEEATAKLVEQFDQPGMYGGAASIPGVAETTYADLERHMQKRLELMKKISDLEARHGEFSFSDWVNDTPGRAQQKRNEEITRLQGQLQMAEDEIVRLQGALGVGITTLPGVHFTYTNVMPGIRSGIRDIPFPGLPRITGPMAMPAERDRGYRQPMSMREAFDVKPFNQFELFSIGGKDALDQVEKFAREAKEKLQQAQLGEAISDGIYGGFQAARRGVDAFADYMMEAIIGRAMKNISDKLAGMLLESIPGGGALGWIFGGSKDASGAKSMNLEWRRARG